MLTGYKAWKLISESFNGSYSLGLKTPSSIGCVGSKLSEMGFGPHDDEEGELDPEMLDMLGGDNQDPEDLDGEEGDDLGGLGDDLEGDDMDDVEDDLQTPELADADAMDSDELGDAGMGDGMGGDMGDDELDLPPHDDMDDLAAMLGSPGPDERGGDGLPKNFFGDEGEGSDEEGDERGKDGLPKNFFGDEDEGGEEDMDPSLFQGDQGEGAPDFGGDEEESDDEDEGDDDDEDEADDEEESDDEVEDKGDDDDKKAEAFAKKKSKKFMGKGCKDMKYMGKSCDDETMYSKKFMSKSGNVVKGKGEMGGMTTKWMQKEENDFFNSLIGMTKGEVHQKFRSGLNQRSEKQLGREPQPGEVGFAPQGKVGALPTVSQFMEWKKNKKGKLVKEMFDDEDEFAADRAMRGAVKNDVKGMPDKDTLRAKAAIAQHGKKMATQQKLGGESGFNVGDTNPAKLNSPMKFMQDRLSQEVMKKVQGLDVQKLRMLNQMVDKLSSNV